MIHFRGYTLLEMIVSVAVFSLVMVVSMSAYLSLIDLDRQSRTITAVVTNLSFATDSIARSLRTGNSYSCNGGTNCTSGANVMSFIDENGRTITYSLANKTIIKNCSGSGCPVTGDVALTDSSISIDVLQFYVRGVGTGDGLQPRVTFTVRGTMSSGTRQAPVEFTLQGAAVQRIIEL